MDRERLARFDGVEKGRRIVAPKVAAVIVIGVKREDLRDPHGRLGLLGGDRRDWEGVGRQFRGYARNTT
jgi:hypothetical protein